MLSHPKFAYRVASKHIILCLFLGHTVLRTSVVVEELGGGQGVRAQDGPQPRHHIRRGEETEEKAAYRLSLLESEASQLLGLPILLL